MAALSDGDWTAISEVTDIVPTEHIQSYIEGIDLPINIGNLIVNGGGGMVPGRGYTTHQFARWADPTFPDPVRAGGATDEVLMMEFSTSSSTLTPVLKGVGFILPEETTDGTTILGNGVPREVLRIAMRKVMEYVDQDILDTVQAATTTVGAAATVPSFELLRTYINAYLLLEQPGMPLFGGNAYFFERLRNEAAVSQSAYMGVLVNGPLLSGQRSAYRGNYLGVDLWESHHIATEAGGANNFMLSVGPDAHRAIGMVAQRAIQARTTQGDNMSRRLSTQTIVSWSDAVGLTFPAGLQECLADAAA